MPQISKGEVAPDFELEDFHGKPHRLSEALGRGPVALFFYKSECPTCQFTLPYLQKLFSRIGSDTPRTFWAISEDDKEETRRLAEQHGFTFDVLIDDHPYAVSAAYELQFVPAMFLIQPDGRIAVSEYGFHKAALNQIAGFEFFTPNDGLPATRPG